MKYLKLILCVLLPCFVVPVAEARWRKPEDADIAYTYFNKDISIHNDGSYEEIIESRGTILKDSGRDRFACYPLMTYNSNCEKFTILSAQIICNNNQYNITKSMIEDKPLVSSGSGRGFDQLNQVTIAFPKLEIGSEVYIKYKRTQKKCLLKTFMEMFFISMMAI